jgi:hypothetical protein
MVLDRTIDQKIRSGMQTPMAGNIIGLLHVGCVVHDAQVGH